MDRSRPAIRRDALAILLHPVTCVALVGILAVLIDLGPLHRGHQGDSLLPVLVSLYKWEPFFWEQDRFGMLIPLLATWVQNPFYNLLVQNALACAWSLIGFFALARIATRSHWVAAGGIAATLFFLTEPEIWRFNLVTTFSPQGHGLGIMAAGVAVLLAGERLRPTRLVAGAALLVLGAWVNTSTAFILIPAILLRGLLSQPEAEQAGPASGGKSARTLVAATLASLAFLASMGLSALAPVRQKYAVLPVTEWPGCWAGLVRNAHGEGLVGAWHLGALGGLVAVGVAALVARRRASRRAVAALVPITLGAVTLVAVLGTLNWTKFQSLAARYSLGAVVALDVAVAGFAAVALLDALSERARRRLSALTLAGFAAVCLFLYFPPSPARVRLDLERTLGARTAEVINAGVTHVAGSYWTVWPTVYHANLVLYEQGSDRKIWGIAHRAAPTADRWARIPLADWRVAAIPEEFKDPFTAMCLRAYGLPPLRQIGRLPTFTLYKPAMQSGEAPRPGGS